jgi:putative GTP pyrophosphokinase
VQDAWSVLDHKIKYKRSIPETLKRRINCLAALFELADQEFRNIRDETIKLENKVATEEKLIPNPPVSAEPPVEPIEPDLNLELDAFNFAIVAEKCFPRYVFGGKQVDGFVDDIKQLVGKISANWLLNKFLQHKSKLEEYREHLETSRGKKLNPYTSIRHAIYMSDKEKYRTILFFMQRQNFDEWLQNQIDKST